MGSVIHQSTHPTDEYNQVQKPVLVTLGNPLLINSIVQHLTTYHLSLFDTTLLTTIASSFSCYYLTCCNNGESHSEQWAPNIDYRCKGILPTGLNVYSFSLSCSIICKQYNHNKQKQAKRKIQNLVNFMASQQIMLYQ